MSAGFPTEADVADGWEIKELPEVGRVLAKWAYRRWMIVWWAEKEGRFQWQVQTDKKALDGGPSKTAAAAKSAAVARAKPKPKPKPRGNLSSLKERLTLDDY
ncbi:hypothetical protein NONI108955_21020 [Nocardia ninae]|uniref:Uncharacterized protein n=1 Tax=Nocardia ninae NBRC 108245 TaxID=1210091 RepID=A0A511MCE5_9NOCA|nr:hypothetical protein [Nocardia ninae]GEM37436.1 hypothetical protein NN4_19550 [Nocardia ninae NBRC 108245]